MKRLLVAVAAALAALAVAAPASAHNADAVIACQAGTLTVTFNYGQFPENSTNTSQETVTVNGTVEYDEPFNFTGDSASSPVTLSPFSGIATVTAAWAWSSSDGEEGSGDTTEDVDCGTPPTTGGTDSGTDSGTTTSGETTGGGTTGGGTTGSGGVIGATTGGTTGGSPGAETSGELPFTGLPVWIPVLLAFALLVSGGFLLRRKRDDVS
jgi:hypothetical protein